jgi:rsbT co-antagonist protein RsbR
MLDSTRARHVTETLLQNVTETKAKAVIMDVTGISTIDTQTANHFVRMIRALRLMGTELIVTGIRPDVSITMAQQGISFGDIIALRNVQQALEHLRRSIENPERESRLTRQ